MAGRKPVDKTEQKRVTDASHAIASMFATQGYQDVRTTLAPVKRTPTNFLGLDWVTGINAFPLGRTTMVHGPSNEGKSAFCLGLCGSFVERGHPALYVDAEFTLDEGYGDLMMGPHVMNSGMFQSLKPDSYEETQIKVRDFANGLSQLRKANHIPETTGGIVIIDSVKKLVPLKLGEKLANEEGGIDGFGGRAGQFKAALNSQWSDELVPLCHKNNITVVFVAREMANTDDKNWGAPDYKVGGGGNLFFDSTLVLRIDRASFVEQKVKDKPGILYGEKHRIVVHKTKLSTKTDRKPFSYFHTSNGVATPKGLDPARDALELGLRFGLVGMSGAWINFGDYRRQGQHSFCADLYEERGHLAALQAAIRARFDGVEAPNAEDATK